MPDAVYKSYNPEFRVGPKQKSEEDLWKELEQTPLFMQHLPTEENDALDALTALVYDGPPEEIAANFKNQGNECFQVKQYKDAIEYYTKGIAAKCQDSALNSLLFSNRAAVHLVLKNFGQTLRDCRNAIQLDAKNVKAYYRAAKACIALDKLDDAQDCIKRGLLVDPNNKALATEMEICQKRSIELERYEQKKREIKLEKQRKEEELERGVKLMRSSEWRPKYQDEEIEVMEGETESSLLPYLLHPQAGQLRVKYDEKGDTIKWPVLFMYPEYKVSDLIAEFDENSTFADHLEAMFEEPAPWDAKKEYTSDSVEIYFQVRSRDGDSAKLLKVGKDMTLGQVLASEQFVVVDGAPSFIILVAKSPYAREFRRLYKN